MAMLSERTARVERLKAESGLRVMDGLRYYPKFGPLWNRHAGPKLEPDRPEGVRKKRRATPWGATPTYNYVFKLEDFSRIFLEGNVSVLQRDVSAPRPRTFSKKGEKIF
jgi:hypothetical protein